jgi:ketosteroid isomerase-like protein
VTAATRPDTVRELVDAFNQGLISDDLIQSFFDPEVELLDFPEIPGRRRYQGHDGIRQFMTDLADNWKTTALEVEEIREVGDRVIILGELKSVGAMTGVPVESAIGEVIEFKGDRIAEVRMFRDQAEALEAADA